MEQSKKLSAGQIPNNKQTRTESNGEIGETIELKSYCDDGRSSVIWWPFIQHEVIDKINCKSYEKGLGSDRWSFADRLCVSGQKNFWSAAKLLYDFFTWSNPGGFIRKDCFVQLTSNECWVQWRKLGGFVLCKSLQLKDAALLTWWMLHPLADHLLCYQLCTWTFT